MNRPLLALAYFVLALASSLLSEFGSKALFVALKGFPLLILLVTLFPAAFRRPRRVLSRYLWIGLAASLVGDLVIEASFLAGIGAFFTAHVSYLLAMGFSRRRLVSQALVGLPAVLLFVTFFKLLVLDGRAPAELRAAVAAYVGVISAMLGRAAGRGLVEPADRGARFMLVGALFFTASDMMIALHRWIVPVPYHHFSIMITYFIGQWLISRAALAEER